MKQSHVLIKVEINEKMTKILYFFGRKEKRNLAKEKATLFMQNILWNAFKFF